MNQPQTPSPEPDRPVVLTIAGFDPSAGAGVTADLKVFAAHRLYGVSAIAALTIQSTQGVRRVCPVDPEFLAETLDCLSDDLTITGIKIGMLATEAVVEVVARFLAFSAVPRERIVLDPVIRSTSGRELLDPAGLACLQNELLPLVGWITPNVDELASLTGTGISGRESVSSSARRLAASYPGLNVVVTGGHLDPPDDFLLAAAGTEPGAADGTEYGAGHWFPGQRIETTATHGTGCTFSSALLCRLVMGASASDAVAAAKQYVRDAMENAYAIGKGRGPLHHLYALDKD
ncbi:MAG TPA: bifunctional hydroxymethylpyrimidine kinase/phosphomethylpyrimidine kinase [Silvibacterium sp.]|nr:bifunctional hydroxymethylpyrimidine kinase/phosphomethylpyrimidine kinase [Silvibacterium sp.]